MHTRYKVWPQYGEPDGVVPVSHPKVGDSNLQFPYFTCPTTNIKACKPKLVWKNLCLSKLREEEGGGAHWSVLPQKTKQSTIFKTPKQFKNPLRLKLVCALGDNYFAQFKIKLTIVGGCLLQMERGCLTRWIVSNRQR